MSTSDAIEHFLATGDVDPDFDAWDGDAACGSAVLDTVLRRVVSWRARRAPLPPPAPPADLLASIWRRVRPMVAGLLGDSEALQLAGVLPARVEVVTVQRFVAGIPEASLELRWTLANLLLDDMGAPPLADDAPQLDGFCEDGRASVLPRAFSGTLRWSDPLVHECAHLLHDLARDQVGLGPSGQPLLHCAPIDHENFAYACELWTCILDRSEAPTAALGALRARGPILDPQVDVPRLDAALARACEAPDRGYASLAASLGVASPLAVAASA